MTGGAKAALLAVAALAVVPAGAQAKRGLIYDMTKATGFERLTFNGDQPDCATFATCGYSGTVTYRIGGKPKGIISMTKGKRGRVNASAKYKANGVATSQVTAPPGGMDCTDTVAHKYDTFSLLSSGSKFQSLLLTYHANVRDDALETACPGPTEADVENVDALPEGLFNAKDFFRGTKPTLAMSGATPFKASGFSATIEWKLSFKARQRDCSPRCNLPDGTP